ncbi:DNA cytosine methyltransferase [Pseudomonas fluorescens]|nr:DNA cytosine methyltransferase [Pseudomonas fluorescens]
MAAYYNEFDPYDAQWLRNLIEAGHIAPGIVDERSIEDVHPGDLRGFTQCHFFAGIGVWSLALRRAGWPDDRPVWTGSCPCQPFSKAGEGLGFADERHLWPAWHHLISQRKPPELLGEQVPDSIKKGWLDLVRDDLEASNYAFGAIRFGSDSTGGAIERQRIYFAAKHIGQGVEGSKPGVDLGQVRPRRWRGQEDLLAIARAPFVPGDSWPQPLLRSVADGASANMGPLHAIGNAINAEAATQFIAAYLET